jgi:hypothetical protein
MLSFILIRMPLRLSFPRHLTDKTLFSAAVTWAIPQTRSKSKIWKTSSRRPFPRRETARRRRAYDLVRRRQRGNCLLQYF